MSVRIPQPTTLAFVAMAALSALALAGGSTSGTAAINPACADEAPQLKTHSIAKGHFELTAPADWTLTEQKLEPWQEDTGSATSLRIQNGRGEDMAAIMTSGLGQTSLTFVNKGQRYTQLDRATPNIEPSSFYSFDALGTTGDTASINLNCIDLAGPTNLSHLDSLFTYDGNYGNFRRNISKNEQLDGVPASVKGMERLRAHAKTTEYGQIKAMMISLERTEKAASGTPRADADADRPCVGALYTYNLADSGMSCAEAESFVKKLADARPSAGSVEIRGHGSCELPYPGHAGRCIVGETGATFNYEMKQ
ncbi:hypothetical protein ACIPUB_13010 [Paeniglutamicibacter sp. ORCA_105]|uniref:hypothetical protein n=1 Tax=Paeniglutamicibacter sp. ORCA_105 TaxID=3377336 RepID=UPI00389366AC